AGPGDRRGDAVRVVPRRRGVADPARRGRGRLMGEVPPDAPAGTEDLLRELAPQVLGALVRRYGHFDSAEDAVQEALLAAARQWPRDGVPDSPRGWLITVASRRLTDELRSEDARRRREEATWAPEQAAPPVDEAGAADRDDSLTLLFLCC